MLYINRFVGDGSYGVVDTDDGSETVISHSDLSKCCIELGLDIKGVTIAKRTLSGGGQADCIFDVKVYQSDASLTSKQTKDLLLRGVDVKTYKGEIVSIEVKPGSVPVGYRLRLSDYGNSCGEYILKSMPEYWNNPFLVLVLDDKVRINGKTLKWMTKHGVSVDTHEVTDQKVIWIVCRELTQSLTKMDMVKSYVFDSQDRMDFYMSFAILSRWGNEHPTITGIGDVVHDARKATRIVLKKYKSEFLKMASNEHKWTVRGIIHNESIDFLKWLADPINRGILDFGDYDSLRKSNFMQIFRVLREASACNPYVLLRFENFFNWFIVDSEMQSVFVDFCRNTGNFLYSYSLQSGLVR